MESGSHHTMNHQSYSPVVKHFAWLWWSPTASEALSYRLNLYRSMPPDFPRTLCIIRSREKFGALRAPHGRTNPTLYLCPGPPLLQPLGPPLLNYTLLPREGSWRESRFIWTISTKSTSERQIWKHCSSCSCTGREFRCTQVFC